MTDNPNLGKSTQTVTAPQATGRQGARHRLHRPGRLHCLEGRQRVQPPGRPHPHPALPQLQLERRDPPLDRLRHLVLPGERLDAVLRRPRHGLPGDGLARGRPSRVPRGRLLRLPRPRRQELVPLRRPRSSTTSSTSRRSSSIRARTSARRRSSRSAAGYDTQSDYTAYAGDVFFDWPVGDGGPTAQVDYIHYDGGVTFNTAALFKQDDLFTEAGWFFGGAQAQPYLRYEQQRYSDSRQREARQDVLPGRASAGSRTARTSTSRPAYWRKEFPNDPLVGQDEPVHRPGPALLLLIPRGSAGRESPVPREPGRATPRSKIQRSTRHGPEAVRDEEGIPGPRGSRLPRDDRRSPEREAHASPRRRRSPRRRTRSRPPSTRRGRGTPRRTGRTGRSSSPGTSRGRRSSTGSRRTRSGSSAGS